MVITVAAGSLLLPGRMAFLFAAIAAISVLGEYAWRTYILGIDFSEGFTQHGLLESPAPGIAQRQRKHACRNYEHTGRYIFSACPQVKILRAVQAFFRNPEHESDRQAM